jgi:phosphomannomutase / phosphoglucomutase
LTTQQISPAIFKAYDIRGIVDKTLTVDAVRQIGRAVALLARERGVNEVVVGRDGRLSGPAFIEALTGGQWSTTAMWPSVPVPV